MANLALRSVAVLGVLWGMVFAIGMAALYAMDLQGPVAMTAAIGFTVAIALLQYLISPLIIQWVHKIDWMPADAADPAMAEALTEACRARGVKVPRFGVIEDGNPNAFTFGHHPGDARIVVTRGLIDLCDPEERKAVVLHELGHVVHWDFVVMTVAATVPLILYVIYRVTLRAGRGSRRDGGAILLVGLSAYIAYIISQYVVLFLSRVREYYADRYAAETQRNPNALATALVKIAYGLASAAKAPPELDEKGNKKEPSIRTLALTGGMRSMGIFDPTQGASMALAAAASYSGATRSYDAATTTKAMRWDVWNPWALVCELSSSHPLPAKRIRALGQLSHHYGQTPALEVPDRAPEGYWDEFLQDLLAQYLPLWGLVAGVGTAFGLGIVRGFDSGEINLLMAPIGAIVAGWALGSFLRVLYAYPRTRFPERNVDDLVAEVKVSQIRSRPATLRGRIIGRGIPGLYWSDDLVIQDQTGFMVMDYRQPIALLQTLFGLFRAESFVGQDAVATGWYRRFPRPYFELWQVRLADGTVNTCHNWAMSFYGSLLFTALGLCALLFGLILQMGA